MLAQLTSFSDPEAYGSLGARLFGLAVSNGKPLLQCVKDDAAAGDFESSGFCLGTLTQLILDAPL